MSEEILNEEIIKEEELDAETPTDQDGSLLVNLQNLSSSTPKMFS